MSFSGFHDMSAFADLEGEDPRCEIQSCEMVEEGSLILLRTTASHFLRKQVRRMVGAAVSCALHKARVDAILHDLDKPSAEANLCWSKSAAASSGLFLEHVRYKGEPGPGTLRPVTQVL
jgi:tRNA pseudouridine38-40 synthase